MELFYYAERKMMAGGVTFPGRRGFELCPDKDPFEQVFSPLRHRVTEFEALSVFMSPWFKGMYNLSLTTTRVQEFFEPYL
jgi:hypothetical protein